MTSVTPDSTTGSGNIEVGHLSQPVFFNLKKDVYLATIYISPENSTSNVQSIDLVYEQLISDIVKYSSLGYIMIQGDFNAYTNTSPDFIKMDNHKHSISDDLYVK